VSISCQGHQQNFAPAADIPTVLCSIDYLVVLSDGPVVAKEPCGLIRNTGGSPSEQAVITHHNS
jgi:hypothetical protein